MYLPFNIQGLGSLIPYQQQNKFAGGKQGVQPDLQALMKLLIRRGSLGLGIHQRQISCG